MRDYQCVAPSLGGILYHESIIYDGIRRPEEVKRLMDSPGRADQPINLLDGQSADAAGSAAYSEDDRKIIDEYFHDLYGIFMKKLSHFIVESELRPDDEVKLQAMLQEMIKIKKLLIFRGAV